MTTEGKDEAIATVQQPGEQELHNPLDFVKSGLEVSKGGVPGMFLWAGGSLIATAAVILPALASGDHPIYAFLTFLVATLAVGMLTYGAWKSTATVDVQREWRVVQQPLPFGEIETLADRLRNVHSEAVKAFQKTTGSSDIGKKNIRANMFLVDYRRATEGIGCELRMPSQLRVMMNNAQEWNVAFQPGWGATGEAFRSGQVVMTTDRLFGIPQSLVEIYDKQFPKSLKGVISIPIQDDDQASHASVVAVLNIDVTDFVVEYRHLNEAYDEIKQSRAFRGVVEKVNGMPKARLIIGLRRA